MGYSLHLLTAEKSGCGTSRGVEWLDVQMLGTNLDSGISFLWGGDTAEMPKSPVYKEVRAETVSLSFKGTIFEIFDCSGAFCSFQTWYKAVLIQHIKVVLLISEDKKKKHQFHRLLKNKSTHLQ